MRNVQSELQARSQRKINCIVAQFEMDRLGGISKNEPLDIIVVRFFYGSEPGRSGG
jgi:hypothetical protein